VKFVADENLDRQIVDRLRLDGHNVTYIAEIAPGILDETVFERSRETESVLITADKDFGELVFRQHQSMSGILPVRLAGLMAQVKASMVAAAIRDHAHEMPSNFS
jgi:predicted nuclease of predicted toxin-antitoxin system